MFLVDLCCFFFVFVFLFFYVILLTPWNSSEVLLWSRKSHFLGSTVVIQQTLKAGEISFSWCFDVLTIFLSSITSLLCPKCNVKYFITWLEYIAFFWDVSLSGITWNTSRFWRHGIKKSHFIMKECEVMQPESFSQRFSRSQIQSREKNFYDKIYLSFIFRN